MKPAIPVYVLSGVADFRPPEVWEKAASQGDLLEENWETGKLEPLYGESLLWRGFEKLVAEAANDGVDLSRTRTINIGMSYPRELAQMMLALAATYMHHDKFDFESLFGWAWLTAYVSFPTVVLVVLALSSLTLIAAGVPAVRTG